MRNVLEGKFSSLFVCPFDRVAPLAAESVLVHCLSAVLWVSGSVSRVLTPARDREPE